jgi:diketogulonate reductase-like aldo/keto reductase
LPSQDLIARLKLAFQLGIRHIDCAESYGTEREVGIAIQESGVAREELFITTKVGSGIKDIPGALNQSLAKLKLEYVDLYAYNKQKKRMRFTTDHGLDISYTNLTSRRTRMV